MGKRSSQIWVTCSAAFMVLVLVCPSIHGRGYLTLVGPGHFRFQKAPPEQNDALLSRNTENGNDNDSFAAQASSPPYNSPIVVNSPPVAHLGPEVHQYLSPLYLATAENVDWHDVIAYDVGNPSGVTTVSSASANNLLVVTPQMLVNYFKPGTTSTNGGGASVLVPFGFSPPGNNPALPSSQAIYKSP